MILLARQRQHPLVNLDTQLPFWAIFPEVKILVFGTQDPPHPGFGIRVPPPPCIQRPSSV